MRIALRGLGSLYKTNCIVTCNNRYWSDWCCHTSNFFFVYSLQIYE